MKMFCQYMAIFFIFSLTSSQLYPLQVETLRQQFAACIE